MNDTNNIGKNFKVFFTDGKIGFFKCNFEDGEYLGNMTFGFLFPKSQCELLPEWAQ
jgi:hypothetical protein